MYKTSHTSNIYIEGVRSFIKAAEANRVNKGNRLICCPCEQCKNFQSYNAEDIEFHLLQNGFMPRYTCWSRHGESLLDWSTSSTRLHINDDHLNEPNDDDYNNDSYLDDDDDHLNEPNDNLSEMLHDIETNMGDAEQEKLQHLFEDEKKPLYTGSKFMKLDAVLKLVNLKSKNGWSDKSFTSLLVILHDMLPEDNELPISTYQAKKLMCPMGLEVERIHACPNDCMLYRKEYANEHKCVFCKASRYKRKKESDEVDDDVTKNGPPAKMLWYLPIIPRLKRLFSNEKEAKLLRWHSEKRVSDGKLRHFADSPQWRNIDSKYPEFGREMRNIRFGLSSDGINPFGNMSSRHSTWPVLLCIYNLPPWLCMKRKYIMMSLLIQGPRQPGNDIDVYLSPLIDDLKTLWSSGVNVYDAYKKEHFQLRAMVMCTISDFPAYGNLSGYTTKGKKACPVCEDETKSVWLKNCKKTVYMGHRRFLPKGHNFRQKTVEFDGSIEEGTMRARFNAFSRVENLNTTLGKRTRVDKGARVDKGLIWKKRSIFWDLPYWRDLNVRHCLDVMHIEKNVCDSLIGLLLDIPGKTKDGINVRKDMVLMGIRKDLAPEQRGNRIYLPPACYNTSKEEKRRFCECLHDWCR
ncbi:putative Transposase-associated domain-containing protein [Helianthus annuus]|nr:putative Transposase-associated domain-containing protein [Helianthus annuus]KAJ0484730.1 putative Transposase-associated domain-containing protein [Helianthus annuus]KAJ0655286.1 putative Transposase-associated domain-containing protein [Helianthus annuus]